MKIKGSVKIDSSTKNLIKRLQPYEIAVIDHKDLDKIAAEELAGSKVKAVINIDKSISGKYPNYGPMTLLDAGIPLIDNVGDDFLNQIEEGEEILIDDGDIYKDDRLIYRGKVLDKEKINYLMEQTKDNYSLEIEKFVYNTLDYAKKEIDIITKGIELPYLKTRFKNRHSLIVVRGEDYKKDLKAIHSYIKDVRPVIIGVDGGADALLDAGYKPDIIVGDMDSVTDRALRCGAELVVHAYPNGRAPGLNRIQNLGINSHVIKSPGTSEDLAMLISYQKGTQLIVAVGTHSNVYDFLEKGRKGMASTFLVRTKIGSILVDAKGVNKLYRSSLKLRHVMGIVAAAMVPLAVIFVISPTTYQIARLIVLQIKLMFNI